jgi:hypothetical protein
VLYAFEVKKQIGQAKTNSCVEKRHGQSPWHPEIVKAAWTGASDGMLRGGSRRNWRADNVFDVGRSLLFRVRLD